MAAAAPAPLPPADKPKEMENVVKDLQSKPTPKVPEKAPTPEPKQKPQPAKPKTNYPDPIINEKTVKHPKDQKPAKPGKPGEPEKD